MVVGYSQHAYGILVIQTNSRELVVFLIHLLVMQLGCPLGSALLGRYIKRRTRSFIESITRRGKIIEWKCWIHSFDACLSPCKLSLLKGEVHTNMITQHTKKAFYVIGVACAWVLLDVSLKLRDLTTLALPGFYVSK